MGFPSSINSFMDEKMVSPFSVRSGWGIMAMTFPAGLHTAARLCIDPFGFVGNSFAIFPPLSQYRNTVWSLVIIFSSSSSGMMKRPSPWAKGMFIHSLGFRWRVNAHRSDGVDILRFIQVL